ncbi:uncharacterized protein LOC110108268 isoform X1 [Dendrobium catenatum]|uniref:Uncharacterized protein n=1 Tax=Dendrobium catenatum TaxID=906689 RepID=A0A2I0WNV0_9ASPA|nr:uncharacterized protein LOC110108268 isoform X1 [Dendrobium catenatum]PKU77343.1 hypothetical protein MA16_Dca026287 [Dendrobium catenatum]
MARGFRGMKDDFMEIINHIIGLSCCSVAHDDNNEGLFLPLPQPTVGDFSCLEVSREFSATDTEVSDAAATEGATCSAPTSTATVDDGAYSVISTGFSLPQAEYVVIDEGLDPGFAAVGNTHCPTFQSEENFWRGYHASLNIKLYENDSESLPSSRIVKDNQSSPKILERNSSSRSLNYMGRNAQEEEQGTSKERSFDSASDIEDYYFYSRKEGEDASIQKHILVEDHMASISLSEGLQLRKRTNKNFDEEEIRDFHEIDGFEYVIV